MQNKHRDTKSAYAKRKEKRALWQRVVSVLVSIVVFCTTYALILPALTLEKNAVCGIAEHIHEAVCFSDDDATLVCEINEHTHGEECYDLSEDDHAKVYEAFKALAKKKPVSNKELDAIVATSALQVTPAYKLINYVINSGNIIISSAQITLEKDEQEKNAIAIGDGPIDAAFNAIEQILGHHYELDDFQIQSVTEGREAVGSAIVRLRSNGKLYAGKGISTDIIGASIKAYINAINKIIFEEN